MKRLLATGGIMAALATRPDGTAVSLKTGKAPSAAYCGHIKN